MKVDLNKKRFTDKELMEIAQGHRLCGWVGPKKDACDCGYYDELRQKFPHIPPLLCALQDKMNKGYEEESCGKKSSSTRKSAKPA